MYTPEIINSLDAVGFIGTWQVDFTTHKVRGDGKIGPLFGISAKKALQGVSLDLLDKAYLREDLEMIKRHRRRIAGAGGYYSLNYKLFDAKVGDLISVQSRMQVKVDPYGVLKEAKGILLRTPTPILKPANYGVTHEEALRHLINAANAVDALGYTTLKSILQIASKEVAQRAAREKAYY